MKIYYKSKIAKLFTFIDGYKTIMLFGAVFTERDSISLRAEYHEEAHCNQYHTMFCFGMFISLLTIGLCLLFGKGGGGYGGGGGGVRYSMVYAGAGGDGTVLIRGRRYKS